MPLRNLAWISAGACPRLGRNSGARRGIGHAIPSALRHRLPGALLGIEPATHVALLTDEAREAEAWRQEDNRRRHPRGAHELLQLDQCSQHHQRPETLPDQNEARPLHCLALALRAEHLGPLHPAELDEIVDDLLKIREVAPCTVRLAPALRIWCEGRTTDGSKPNSQGVEPAAVLHLAVVRKDNRPDSVMAVTLPLLKVELQATSGAWKEAAGCT
mmetsp:Transcript_6199/g.16560  ORF Transcript_6199/g.16560 Transcript_6199/m.16560 type:complete len:216 (-) Transcript_6199:160-807(-)